MPVTVMKKKNVLQSDKLVVHFYTLQKKKFTARVEKNFNRTRSKNFN